MDTAGDCLRDTDQHQLGRDWKTLQIRVHQHNSTSCRKWPRFKRASDQIDYEEQKRLILYDKYAEV